MAVSHSAGIVMVRPALGSTSVEVFLVHPGGPFWAKKDEHAWSIPKGEFDPEHEPAEDAARQEFLEETGQPVPAGEMIELKAFRAGAKWIHPFLLESEAAATFDAATIESNTFEMEWPPRSGVSQTFPEVDRAAWVLLCDAESKLHKGQRPIVAAIELR